MYAVYKISIALLLSFSTVVGETSFFFSDKESNAILNKKTPEKINNKSEKITYKLSGILFINTNNWTVWINDKPYSSIGNYGEFSINFVSNRKVNLTLSDGQFVTLSLDA